MLCVLCGENGEEVAQAGRCTNRCELWAHPTCAQHRQLTRQWRRKHARMSNAERELCPHDLCRGKATWFPAPRATKTSTEAEGPRHASRREKHERASSTAGIRGDDDDAAGRCAFVNPHSGRRCGRVVTDDQEACCIHREAYARVQNLLRAAAARSECELVCADAADVQGTPSTATAAVQCAFSAPRRSRATQTSSPAKAVVVDRGADAAPWAEAPSDDSAAIARTLREENARLRDALRRARRDTLEEVRRALDAMSLWILEDDREDEMCASQAAATASGRGGHGSAA